MTTHSTELRVAAIRLQDAPPVYVTVIPGKWLLKHTTPSWRLEDPEKGFQRIVKKPRAEEIARTVLDKGRAFPNAITLATNAREFKQEVDKLVLPERTKFLVVDGQHRLWAQKFSNREGQYACIVHLNKTEQQMAELFLEINDNQRRVPSSLRWDLVRLVRPKGSEIEVMTSELVYDLSTRADSPFYVLIDLTGEKTETSVKQGSLAPEIRTLISKTRKRSGAGFDEYSALLIRFFSAVRSLNPTGWGDSKSTYYKTRVLRALVRVLADLAVDAQTFDRLTAEFLLVSLKKINPDTLSEERVRTAQGAAGVAQLYQEMRSQVFA
jgi:DGQHR domain-containing protein